CRVAWHIRVEEQSTEFLARAENLAPFWSTPSLIRHREVEQLEGTRQRSLETPAVVAAMCPNRALHFAAHVGQLLHEREGLPALRRLCVNGRCRAHRFVTNAWITRRIAARVLSSSTSRLRLFCEGRTLIMESNSIHSGPDSLGYKLMPQRSACREPSSSRSASSSEYNSPLTA